MTNHKKICALKPRPGIYEVGIGYSGRTCREGRKINRQDDPRAIHCILLYNVFGR